MPAGSESNTAFVPPEFEKPPKEDCRWLVAAVIAIAAVFVVIVAAFALGVFSGPGPAPVPLDTALSLGTPWVGHGFGSNAWVETILIQKSAPALTINSLSFSVQTPSGGVVPAPAGSVVDLTSAATGIVVANYTFATGAWAGAPLSTPVTSEDFLNMTWVSSSSSDPLTGDDLVVLGSNGYIGTTETTLA